LSQALRERLGEEHVYMDVTDIRAGADFRSEIERATNECDVFLTVIGDDWLTCKNPDGTRRLDDPHDLVRSELANALRLQKRVIPVLVENASMPKPKDLPIDLEPVSWLNAVEVRHTHWDRDVADLIQLLAGTQRRRKRSALLFTAATAVLGLIGALAWWRHSVAGQCKKAVCALVANFGVPDPAGVTEILIDRLRQATDAEDIEINPLGYAISETDGSDVPRQEGLRRKATMVIWGWYQPRADSVLVSANFVLLDPPRFMPALAPSKWSAKSRGVADLNWRLSANDVGSLEFAPASELTYLTLVTVGMLRYTADDWAGAIQQFTLALEQPAGQASTLKRSLIYYKRGLSYGARGDHARAMADYNRVLQLDSTYVDAFIGRGLTYYRRGSIDSALADFDHAIRLDTANALAYSDRGVVRAYQKEFQLAITDYSRAIELKPDDPSFLQGRAQAHFASEQYDLAIADYDSALTLKPDESVYYQQGGFDQAEALYERGNVYYAKGDYSRAIKDYDHAIKHRSDFFVAFHQRGRAHNELANYRRAVRDFTKAIELKPDEYVTYHNRGLAYLELGDLDRAIADYDRAIRLAPDDPLPYNDRGYAYFRRGEFDRAIADYDKALQLKPDYTLARDNRSIALRAKPN